MEFSTRRDSSRCFESLQRLQLEITCLNGKKEKDDQTMMISVEMFGFVRYDLRSNVTFCLVWFVQKNEKIQGRD